jgi:hypothetical protein
MSQTAHWPTKDLPLGPAPGTDYTRVDAAGSRSLVVLCARARAHKTCACYWATWWPASCGSARKARPRTPLPAT